MKKLNLYILVLALSTKAIASEKEIYTQDFKKKISETIYLTHGIMAQSPEIIKSLQGEKIYLQESFIEKVSPSELGGMIHINAETKVYLPLLFSDDKGYWTSVMTEFWNKIFHQICNVCHYEWEAKWYEFECPNCGSTDFSNISS